MGSYISTYLNPVFILLIKAVKARSVGDGKTPSIPLFNELQLLKLTDISNLQLASFVCECVNGLSSQIFKTNSLVNIVKQHDSLQEEYF